MNPNGESRKPDACPATSMPSGPDDTICGCDLRAGHWGPHITEGVQWVSYDLGTDGAA